MASSEEWGPILPVPPTLPHPLRIPNKEGSRVKGWEQKKAGVLIVQLLSDSKEYFT